jgi:hypothetical protein
VLKGLLEECTLPAAKLSGVSVEQLARGIKKDDKTAGHYLSGETVPSETELKPLELFLSNIHPNFAAVRKRLSEARLRSKRAPKYASAAVAEPVSSAEDAVARSSDARASVSQPRNLP